jgi:nucleoside-diphosphate-sugar epimerase
MLTGSKIAVTGFEGFIGRKLVQRLNDTRADLVLLDGDVRDPATWKKDFDYLYHLASVTAAGFVKNPSEAFSVNVNGTINALEACRQRRAAMIFPSTCGVYKPVQKGPTSEADATEAKTPYTASKLIDEILCASYSRDYGIRCCVLRLFNVYGAGQQELFIVPYLVRSVMDNDPPTVKHPDSIRDFIHVDDVVDAMLRSSQHMGPESRFLNVGSGKPFAIKQVIELISEIVDRPMKWIHESDEGDTHPAVWANIERAKDVLDWAPQVDLRQGLTEMIKHMAKNSNPADRSLTKAASSLPTCN